MAPRTTGRRSMTFTGCWTCKRRKVKCDERPRVCGNCERLKLDCGGYGVRLHWLRVNGHDGEGAKTIVGRGKVEPSWNRHAHYSLDKIDEFLASFDEDGDESPGQRGPFNTFNSQPVAARTHARRDSSSTTQPASVKVETPSDDITGNSLTVYRPAVMPHDSAAKNTEMYLMHHYVTHIAGLLIPIQHPMNPYRNLYVPAALAAASSPSPKATDGPIIHSVLMHSLLASSAYHLFNCVPTQTRYHRIGSQHRQKALGLLQSAISLSLSEDDYQTMLMAMLSLVSIDVMSGCEADYTIHLRGTKQLRTLMRQGTLTSRMTRQLVEMSDFLSLLIRSIPSTARSHADLMHFNNHSLIQPPDSCVFYLYGVTPQIASAIQETCRIAETLHWHERRKQPVPQSLVESSERLHQDLLAWSVEGEAPLLSAIDSPDMLDIFQHHANAWHQATLVYYSRRVRRCVGPDVTPYIDAVAANMHAAEDVKGRSAVCAGAEMAPITWPAFVASCEARQREPWCRWWERARGYRIANIEAQWTVVQRVWGEMDRVDGTRAEGYDWIDAVRAMGLSLLPI